MLVQKARRETLRAFIFLAAMLRNEILKWFAVGIAFAVSVMLAETALRFAGYEPGRIYYAPWFYPVDSLIVHQHTFIADSAGITKFSDATVDYVRNKIASGDAISDAKVFSEVSSLIENFSAVQQRKVQNVFAEYYQSANPSTDSFLIQYVRQPINAHGFKSVDFNADETSKKKVLIIGDSHAFGHSCANLTSGFADVLLTKDYMVYNTGLSGADPVQYEVVARRFIPELKPDFVLVNLFLENDVVYHHRPLQPYQPYLWVTNAGHLFTCPEGIFFNSPDEAYRNMLRHFFIPRTNTVNTFCASTVITTFIWRALQKYSYVVNNSTPEFAVYDEQVRAMKSTKPYTNIHVKQIQEIAAAHGAACFVFTIPQKTRFGLKGVKDFPHLLDDITFHECDFLSSDYAEIGGHLNEQGHSKFADFVIETISK